MCHFINQSSLQICPDNFRSDYSEKIFWFNICIAVPYFIFQIFLPYPSCLKWHGHKPKSGGNPQITYFLQHIAMEHLNTKQAQSETSSKSLCLTHSSSLCSVPALCSVPSHRLRPFFILGATGCKPGGHSRTSCSPEPSPTH